MVFVSHTGICVTDDCQQKPNKYLLLGAKKKIFDFLENIHIPETTTKEGM